MLKIKINWKFEAISSLTVYSLALRSSVGRSDTHLNNHLFLKKMQQQGTEIIKKAVEYDSQGNCFWKGCNWTGKLREAIEAYKAGSKRLYEALRCKRFRNCLIL